MIIRKSERRVNKERRRENKESEELVLPFCVR
jgi:hypothetical protein